jgi:hypothetical protein
MSIESLETVMKLWETEQLTVEQVIGKILLWLHEHQKRLLKLESRPSRFDDNSQRKKGKK